MRARIAVVVVSLFAMTIACIDFEGAEERWCEQRPDLCDAGISPSDAGGGVGGGGGTAGGGGGGGGEVSDGGTDAGVDAGETLRITSREVMEFTDGGRILRPVPLTAALSGLVPSADGGFTLYASTIESDAGVLIAGLPAGDVFVHFGSTDSGFNAYAHLDARLLLFDSMVDHIGIPLGDAGTSLLVTFDGGSAIASSIWLFSLDNGFYAPPPLTSPVAFNGLPLLSAARGRTESLVITSTTIRPNFTYSSPQLFSSFDVNMQNATQTTAHATFSPWPTTGMESLTVDLQAFRNLGPTINGAWTRTNIRCGIRPGLDVFGNARTPVPLQTINVTAPDTGGNTPVSVGPATYAGARANLVNYTFYDAGDGLQLTAHSITPCPSPDGGLGPAAPISAVTINGVAFSSDLTGVGQHPTVSWQPAPGASRYILSLADVTSGSAPEIAGVVTERTTLRWPHPLAVGRTYRLIINAEVTTARASEPGERRGPYYLTPYATPRLSP